MEPSITFPSDKIITFKEILTQKLNKWNETLIERTAFYHEALMRYNRDPKQVVQTAQNGRMGIGEIVDARISGVVEARSWVKTLQAMIEENEKGSLDTRWSDAQLVSPLLSDTAALGIKR